MSAEHIPRHKETAMGKPAHVERAIAEEDTSALQAMGQRGGMVTADRRDMLKAFDEHLEWIKRNKLEDEQAAQLAETGEGIIPLDTYH